MAFIRSFLLLLLNVMFPVVSVEARSAMDMDWEGSINDKIRFSMCIVRQDIESDLIMGEMHYAAGSGKILILGNRKDDALYLKEMLPDGTVSGIMDGIVQDDVYTGKWQAPDKILEKGGIFSAIKGKIYELQARHTKQGCETENIWSFDPAQVAGTYRYSYGKDSAYGTLTVRNEDNGSVAFQIHSVTGAPRFNMAKIPTSDMAEESWAKGHLEGNRLRYEINGSCAFSMTFFRNFVRIEHLDDRVCRGIFGMGAGVTGDFVKLQKR